MFSHQVVCPPPILTLPELYSKHLGKCACCWCLRDSIFYGNPHVGNCLCNWCKLDFKFGGADEPTEINNVVNNKINSSMDSQDFDFFIESWINTSASSLDLDSYDFNSFDRLNETSFSNSEYSKDDSFNSCTSSVIERFMDKNLYNGSVIYCSI